MLDNWLDTLYHILLGIALMVIVYIIVMLIGGTAGAAVVGALFIFLREVTQEQAENYDNDFRKAWDFWNWHRSKNFETWVPIFVTILVGILTHKVFS